MDNIKMIKKMVNFLENFKIKFKLDNFMMINFQKIQKEKNFLILLKHIMIYLINQNYYWKYKIIKFIVK